MEEISLCFEPNVRKTGNNNRVVRTHPFRQAEKRNQTSNHACVLPYRLVCCVVFLSMTTLMCLFGVTANTVSEPVYIILYMTSVKIVWNVSQVILVNSAVLSSKLPRVTFV